MQFEHQAATDHVAQLAVGLSPVPQRAALIGLVVGLAGMTWVFFATDLAWPWYPLVGSAGTFAVGVAASYLFPRRSQG